MKFDEWLYEQEGYGLRIERLLSDLNGPLEPILPWLRAAYEVGYDQAQDERAQDEAGESL